MPNREGGGRNHPGEGASTERPTERGQEERDREGRKEPSRTVDGTATGDESLPPATAAIYAQAMTRQLHTPCFIDTDTMPLSLRPEDPAATRPSPQAPRVRLLSLTRWPSSRPVTLAPLPRPSLPGRSSIVVVRSSRQNRGTRTTLAHTATHPLTTHARPSPPESTGKGRRRRRRRGEWYLSYRALPMANLDTYGRRTPGTELSKREGPSPSPPCPLSPHTTIRQGGAREGPPSRLIPV